MAVSNDYILQLKELSHQSKVVAIGEIGLDYYRDVLPRKEQRKMFFNQLQLAKDLGYPVIIHNRQATEDIMDILSEWCAELIKSDMELANTPGVLHSFSSDLDIAIQAIEMNFFIGISGTVTFKNAHELHHIVNEIPLSKILIETDAPFLTPHPHRGERNEPANVTFVGQKIAQIKNISINEVADVICENAEKIFCLRD
jgi:TatD DNase family protein